MGRQRGLKITLKHQKGEKNMEVYTASKRLEEVENNIENINIEDRYEALRQAQEDLAEAIWEEEREEYYI